MIPAHESIGYSHGRFLFLRMARQMVRQESIFLGTAPARRGIMSVDIIPCPSDMAPPGDFRYNVCRHYTMSFGHGRSAPDAMRRGIMSVDIIPYRIEFVKKRLGHESDADIYS